MPLNNRNVTDFLDAGLVMVLLNLFLEYVLVAVHLQMKIYMIMHQLNGFLGKIIDSIFHKFLVNTKQFFFFALGTLILDRFQAIFHHHLELLITTMIRMKPTPTTILNLQRFSVTAVVLYLVIHHVTPGCQRMMKA